MQRSKYSRLPYVLGVLACVYCTEGSETGAGGAHIVENTGVCDVEAGIETQKAETEIGPLLFVAGDTVSFGEIGAGAMGAGNLYILDALGPTIFKFSEKGEFVSRVGREGDGPGEFRGPTWADLCGADSLYVFDSKLQRVSVFDAQLQFVREFRLSHLNEGRVAQEIRCDNAGNVLVKLWFRPDPAQPEGPYRPNSEILIHDRNGKEIADVGWFPTGERYRYARGSSPRYLGRPTVFDFYKGKLFLGVGDAYEFGIIGENGRTERVVRSRWAPRPITDDDVEWYVTERVSRLREEYREGNRRMWQGVRFPLDYPPYRNIKVDDSGRVWVEDYPAVRDSVVRWKVFSEEGVLLGIYTFPLGSSLLDVNSNNVLLAIKTPAGAKVSLYSLDAPQCEITERTKEHSENEPTALRQ